MVHYRTVEPQLLRSESRFDLLVSIGIASCDGSLPGVASASPGGSSWPNQGIFLPPSRASGSPESSGEKYDQMAGNFREIERRRIRSICVALFCARDVRPFLS